MFLKHCQISWRKTYKSSRNSLFFFPNSEDSSNGLSCVVIVLALVCLWLVQISGGHHHDLENVAYSKKVTLSSEFKDPGYSGSEAFQRPVLGSGPHRTRAIPVAEDRPRWSLRYPRNWGVRQVQLLWYVHFNNADIMFWPSECQNKFNKTMHGCRWVTLDLYV